MVRAMGLVVIAISLLTSATTAHAECARQSEIRQESVKGFRGCPQSPKAGR